MQKIYINIFLLEELLWKVILSGALSSQQSPGAENV